MQTRNGAPEQRGFDFRNAPMENRRPGYQARCGPARRTGTLPETDRDIRTIRDLNNATKTPSRIRAKPSEAGPSGPSRTDT